MDHAIGFMGLGELRRAYPARLSGGRWQRVRIVRPLVLQPRLGFSAADAMNVGKPGPITAIGVLPAAFAVLAKLGLLSPERRVRHRTAR